MTVLASTFGFLASLLVCIALGRWIFQFSKAFNAKPRDHKALWLTLVLRFGPWLATALGLVLWYIRGNPQFLHVMSGVISAPLVLLAIFVIERHRRNSSSAQNTKL